MIDTELDLINGMKIFTDLDFLILTAQVRVATKRFYFIEDLLNKKTQISKYYE